MSFQEVPGGFRWLSREFQEFFSWVSGVSSRFKAFKWTTSDLRVLHRDLEVISGDLEVVQEDVFKNISALEVF